jgi:hypothetical protein
VIDEHLLTGRDVERIGDERFDDVPRELRIAAERRPQPSSSLRYSAAAPTANVGILSRKKFRPWSL